MTSNLDLINYERSCFNILSKTIGIYCINEDNIRSLYKEIVNRIPTKALDISRCCFSKNGYVIKLKDGTIYRFLVANDNTRGYRFDESYVQKEVLKEMYEYNIRFYTWDSNCIYIIEDISDFRSCNHRSANEYYANKYREQEE